MVASSSILDATTSTGGVGSKSASVMDGMLLAQCGSSPHIIRRRRSDSTKSQLDHPKRCSATEALRMIKAELRKPISPSNTDEIAGRNNSKHMRRVRSDNLAQTKRDDPSVRRSIFGDYFKEKPRSYSAPRLVRTLPPPPPPPPVSDAKATDQMQEDRSSPRRSLRRSSSNKILAPNQDVNQNYSAANQPPQHHHHHHHKHPPHHDVHVDYRVFAPSEHQAATSAICYRYRELNRDHEQEYDTLLERQVRVEHSLPPFPSPLIRFCSETTVTVVENESHSFAARNSDGTNRASCNFSSHDREMHYHGVYSLLTPISILKSSRYTNTTTNSECDDNNTPVVYTNADNERKVPTKLEEEEECHDISATLSSSFHFPRSYIDTAHVLKTLGTPPADEVSFDRIVAAEEKKESEVAPIGTISIVPVSTAMKASPFLAPDKFLGDKVSGKRSGLTTTLEAPTRNRDNDSKDETETVSTQPQHQQHQRLRFDPRVTVTEFEDPVPRKWYDENELEQHKREAVVVAQNYLREHRAVAEWYRRATLDPITKTYRKRALYSLPVFSSTYSSTEAEPEIHHVKQCELTVRKIMIVDPNPVIMTLFCKSMKSMFPSAEIKVTRSPERALQILRESNASMDDDDYNGYDIIVVEQMLNSSKCKKEEKREDVCLPGIFDIFMKKQQEPAMSSPPTSYKIRHGSQLIEQVCKLPMEREEEGFSGSPNPPLLIGVSIRPERDAAIMCRAGADIVWGIPIPNVGRDLRNMLLSKLHAKRSLRQPLPSSQHEQSESSKT